MKNRPISDSELPSSKIECASDSFFFFPKKKPNCAFIDVSAHIVRFSEKGHVVDFLNFPVNLVKITYAASVKKDDLLHLKFILYIHKI